MIGISIAKIKSFIAQANGFLDVMKCFVNQMLKLNADSIELDFFVAVS